MHITTLWSSTLLAEAELACDASRFSAALEQLQGVSFAAQPPALALRALLAQGWAHMSLGQLDEADALLVRARGLAEGPDFTDGDRAEAVFRLGCARLSQGQAANAAALLSVALELCGESPSLRRARAFQWRSRCYQRQRDWTAARSDVQRGLEIAEVLGDDAVTADLHFQGSTIAGHEKQWVLARFYAEQALALYEKHDDRLNAHRALNNLGGLNFLLGDVDAAMSCLSAAIDIARELGNDVGIAYALSSLAQIELRTGHSEAAREHAAGAIELLADRPDHAGELGNARLVLGRALLEGGREHEADCLFRAAEQSFEQFGSASAMAAAWVAQGDLAARRGDLESAAQRYREAAEALQDFHF